MSRLILKFFSAYSVCKLITSNFKKNRLPDIFFKKYATPISCYIT